MGKNAIKNILIFVVIFLAINVIFNAFKGNSSQTDTLSKNEVGIMTDAQIPQNKTVVATLKNNTKNPLTIKNECPKEPLDVFKFTDAWKQITAEPKIDCAEAKDSILAPDKTAQVTYNQWNHALFGDLGKYKISLTIQIAGKDKTFESNEFEIVERGFWRKLWDNVLYQPIYNALIFLVNIMPFRDLGLAIIILTLIVRLILFIPSHHAIKSQKRMQEVQPELDRIKEKYKGNQQMIGQETMRIFKENKVNPFGGCLPILIQFPFLIAIFYVIQNGLNQDNAYLIYGFLKGFTLDNINVMFLGVLDLMKKNAYVLPVVIGGLQFLQMKLSFIKTAKKNDEEKPKKSETQSVNNMMLYFMPVMIAIFTASVPAGVGLYWGVSTLFSIGQQFIVNKKKNENEPVVKVINR